MTFSGHDGRCFGSMADGSFGVLLFNCQGTARGQNSLLIYTVLKREFVNSKVNFYKEACYVREKIFISECCNIS